MAENMFCDVVDPSIKVGGRKRYMLPSSIAIHALMIAAAILLPLVVPDVLPATPTVLAFIAPAALPVLPARSAAVRPETARRPAMEVNPSVAPLEAPNSIAPEKPVEPSASTISGFEGALGSVPSAIGEGLAALPPPAQLPLAPVRPGGNIRPPTKIKEVRPTYPAIALAARVQGIVIVEATIGPTGKVENAKILRSIGLLDEAALEAVRQWEYTPTLLNGLPVPVLITVTVRFAMD